MIDNATDNNTDNTPLNIQQLIKEAHDNAVEKGFYDCPVCDKGKIWMKCPDCHGRGCLSCQEVGDWLEDCKACNSTGIDPNKNIGELLMLIVSELGEALEAHRCGRFAEWETYDEVIVELKDNPAYKTLPSDIFNRDIKDTFEDEIADVFIRLFDLCGYKGWELHTPVNISDRDYSGNVAESLLHISYLVVDIRKDAFTINIVLNSLWHFCKSHNIPIQKHITAKMQYNKTRPRLHGKEY